MYDATQGVPTLLRKPYSSVCVEDEFSEVHSSKRSTKRCSERSRAGRWHPIGVETRRFGAFCCHVVYQGVATRNHATTREIFGNLGSESEKGQRCDIRKVRPEATIPPPASGRAQRGSTLAKTRGGLNPWRKDRREGMREDGRPCPIGPVASPINATSQLRSSKKFAPRFGGWHHA